MFNEIYQQMQTGFRSSSLKFLFKRTELGRLLSEDRQPSPKVFFDVFFNSLLISQLWFIFCISSRELLCDFLDMYKTINLLKEVNLYNHDNIERLNESNEIQFAWKWVENLQKYQLLNEENFRLLITQDFPAYLAEGFIFLHRAGMLTPENKAQLIAHSNPGELINGLSCLFHAEVLTPSNFSSIAAAKFPHQCAYALVSLYEKGISVSEYVRWLINEDNPIEVGDVIASLDETNLLTDDNLALVAPRAKDLHGPLRHIKPILTQNNLETLCGATVSLERLDWFFTALSFTRNITQENFDALMLPHHVALLTDEAGAVLFRMPIPYLTQTNFQSLLEASRQPNPLAAIQRVVNQILGPAVANRNREEGINPTQSTHTASVHRSVSDSASRLMARYGNDLALEPTIRKIKAFVNGLNGSPKHQAAKRCIERITARDFSFTDRSSNVSTKQLLALFYTAIHDSANCQASVEDAKVLFVQGLYEIQRGYNLNAAGEDLGGGDHPICDPGAFNKLMEKLGGGIHSDVEIYYITHEGASLKFKKLVQFHASNYLTAAQNPSTPAAYLSMKALLDKIEDEGDIQTIWPMIKEKVKAELWDEFKEAYAHHPDHVEFNRLFSDHFRYVPAPDLAPIQQALANSLGYQAYLSEQRSFSSLEHYSLWANRHHSSQAQHEFDRQCGLILTPH